MWRRDRYGGEVAHAALSEEGMSRRTSPDEAGVCVCVLCLVPTRRDTFSIAAAPLRSQSW